MEIIIGRDQQTRQLCVIKDGNSKLCGQPGSVPMDVSRHHISLQPAGNGKWKIKNLNERNVTFVNGISVESKTISESDKIELGNSHYLFQWSALSELKVDTIDIRPLKKVWDNYQKENKDVEIRKQMLALKKQKQNILRGLTGIFIPLAIVLSIYAGGRENPLFIVLYCIPPLVTLIMTFNQYHSIKEDEQNVVNDREQKDERDLQFRRDYSCPNPKCGKYLNMPYDVLERYDSCPYCHVKFKS